MPNINKSKVVPYSQKQMYKLVNNVELYSKFLPFCNSSQINDYTQKEIRATLMFSHGGFSKAFTTLNRLQPHRMIEIQLINGPFRQLEGLWRFEPVGGNRCRVFLDLEFDFSSRWLALIFGSLFNQVATMLVDVFCERASIIYGKKS